MIEKKFFDKVYENNNAPWTLEKPPKQLVELIESRKIKPCKVIDIGCGDGFYSIYLASKGFDVLGIDFSERAIKNAKENAKKVGVNIRFLVMDAMNVNELKESFDFVFEWAILHGLMPKEREKYEKKISDILNEGGKYLSVCFNDQDSHLGEPGIKHRVAPSESRMAGQELYFSSLNEVKELFSQHFKILEAKTIQMPTSKVHIGNFLLTEKI
ncbi:MAG: class I SAM-dependent methyltransferase [Candidatus Aenigmarchaeota archaeon]|nr:class I SAM-dependent methyltransferase [Candidatus Aenigmarchaeota archaeon]